MSDTTSPTVVQPEQAPQPKAPITGMWMDMKVELGNNKKDTILAEVAAKALGNGPINKDRGSGCGYGHISKCMSAPAVSCFTRNLSENQSCPRFENIVPPGVPFS